MLRPAEAMLSMRSEETVVVTSLEPVGISSLFAASFVHLQVKATGERVARGANLVSCAWITLNMTVT